MTAEASTVVLSNPDAMSLRRKVDAYHTLFDVPPVITLHGKFRYAKMDGTIDLVAGSNVVKHLGTRNCYILVQGSELHVSINESIVEAKRAGLTARFILAASRDTDFGDSLAEKNNPQKLH